MNVTMQAAWLGVGAALLGALIGGALSAVTAWYTLGQQWRREADKRRLDRCEVQSRLWMP